VAGGNTAQRKTGGESKGQGGSVAAVYPDEDVRNEYLEAKSNSALFQLIGATKEAF